MQILFIVLLSICGSKLWASNSDVEQKELVRKSSAVSLDQKPMLLKRETRARFFDQYIKEIERIDGEGLIPRGNRPEKWKQTLSRLREEILNAETQFDFGLVLRRVDATYPNLHAQITLAQDYDFTFERNRPNISVRFAAEEVSKSQKHYRYLIKSVDSDQIKTFREPERPAIGDELLSINDIGIQEWSKQNFIFCKFPWREQCEVNFFDSFRKELLGWDRRQGLTYKLKRNSRVWTIDIPFVVAATKTNATSTTSGKKVEEFEQCPMEKERYPDFEPVLKGLNICVFESQKWPGVAVLSIGNFVYRGIPKESSIQSIKDEVDRFYEKYWKAKGPGIKKLIIDVIDNGGGDVPVSWYQLFLDKSFQEQYVQYKKLPELDDAKIRSDFFYGDPAREIWFSELKQSKKYSQIKFGDFLPPHPGFCVDETKNCNEGMFMPLKHGFQGEVRVLTNEWCISTCTGFVWQMRDKLGKRVKIVGFPESGDSGYARLFLDVKLSDGNFELNVSPRAPRSRQSLPEGFIARQQVSATRTTDAKGKVISAQPMIPDIWVPRQYHNFNESWETQTFLKALNQ